VAGSDESGNQAAAIAAGALDPDHRVCGAVLDQPAQQALVALCELAKVRVAISPPRSSSSAGGMGVLVNVDADNHCGLLAWG
jgi:hypothetical protein